MSTNPNARKNNISYNPKTPPVKVETPIKTKSCCSCMNLLKRWWM